jgi:vitamin B12 transporter
MNPQNRFRLTCLLFLLLLTASTDLRAQGQAAIVGTVVDPVGGRVAAATVTLTGEQGSAGEVRTMPDGTYSFQNIAPGRYRVVVGAAGFETFTSEQVYAGAGERRTVDATLQVGALQQAVVVTAATDAVPQSQTGAPITVIDDETLEALNKPDLLEALRLVPGSQIVQTGARGGNTSLFIRGGNSNFNKVLVDGIPTNDIGGGFDFAQVAIAGVERVEVLRQTNSVMYGSDALAGVVHVTTKRGRTRIPELDYSLDGGNLGTISTGVSLGGAAKRFDYFSAFSHFDTDNEVPNNAYRNDTFASRFGVAVGGATDVSGTLRLIDTKYESANGITLYGIPDDASQTKDQTYFSLAARSQWTDRWQSTVRFGWTDERLEFLNPAPSGTPFDPFGFGANYLGDEVTLTGANGFSVSGRGILDFGGTFPSLFESRTRRRLVAGDTTIQLHRDVAISGGARVEHEEAFDDPETGATATRTNGGGFVEARVSLANRHYISAGVGYERNDVFDSAVTPRVSVATYLRQPTTAAVSDTKVTLNAGTGIKAPSVFQEQNSLLALVQGTPAADGVSPVGPERSRSVDFGVEQGFWGGNARARVAYFHNTFDDLLEFLGVQQLTLAGVPPDVAAATQFGAYLNASSYRARGVEASAEVVTGPLVRVNASYTFLDAEVTEAFSASPAFNDAFPGIPIGAFSPLVGERPFRRPTHSGTIMVMYTQGPALVTVSGYFAGTRDDSTFVTDAFFGNSMLLPNQDLAFGYEKIDLSAAYQVHRRLRGYISIENLLDEEYEPLFGFPALPLTARIGFRLSLGGAP